MFSSASTPLSPPATHQRKTTAETSTTSLKDLTIDSTSVDMASEASSNDNNNKQYGSITIRQDGENATAATKEELMVSRTPSKKSSVGMTSSVSTVSHVLIKTQSTFVEDAAFFREGSVPHSIVLATVIGSVCGAAAFLYYAGLEFMLDYLWKDLPEQIFMDQVSEEWHWLWIPLLGFSLAVCVGLSVVFLGEPGDLPYTIKCVHDKAYVAMDHVLPMVGASQFSILAGGSLGPEAPLVAICAALGGFVSRSVFGVTERNLIRKHTLMGMAGALAAFFGCPLGGSLFALEVCSRFGVEYFEHSLEAIFCGEVCLAVFRTLARLPIKYIWTMPGVEHLEGAETIQLFYGLMLGLFGAFMAFVFAKFHATVMGIMGKNGLLDNKYAVYRALVGAVVIVTAGVLVPHTMFWGEYEFQTVSTLSPASTLEHIWPTTGATGFELDSFWACIIMGLAKLVAISFTVAGGYRGGYIFPIFCAGAAFGRAVFFIFPQIPVQLCVLCMAAAMNVALTRTALATTLILSYLSNEQAAIAPVLAASLVSLFATAYMPFIKTQVDRSDIDVSIFYTFESDDEFSTIEEEQGKEVVDDEEAASKPLLV